MDAMPAGRGNAARERLRRERAFEGRALLICYAPPGEPMAEEALENYMVLGGGDGVAIVVGEARGDTGSHAFDAMLSREFVLDEVVRLPNWPDTAHEMAVWRRRARRDGEAAAAAPGGGEFPAMRCAACARALSARPPGTLRRCRYCRDPAGTFCSRVCCARGLGAHRACHHLRLISTVSDGAMARFDSDVHYEPVAFV